MGHQHRPALAPGGGLGGLLPHRPPEGLRGLRPRANGGCGREAGFTLLELIVTLSILAIAVGLVVPVIGRSTESLRVRAEVAGFAAFLRHAREQAITTRRPLAIVVDPDAHRMTMMAGEEVRRARPLSPRLSVAANPPEAFTVKFEPEGFSSGAEFLLGTESIAFRVSVDPLTGRVRSERR
jgi:prepilin-type N-terminal cleavage/methylation domain-containing protein